jgi:hypothetical protein
MLGLTVDCLMKLQNVPLRQKRGKHSGYTKTELKDLVARVSEDPRVSEKTREEFEKIDHMINTNNKDIRTDTLLALFSKHIKDLQPDNLSIPVTCPRATREIIESETTEQFKLLPESREREYCHYNVDQMLQYCTQQRTWDEVIAPSALKILTYNCHFRPFDGFIQTYSAKYCDTMPFQNAQELRARRIVEFINAMDEIDKPDVIVFQELTHNHSIDIIHNGLLSSGYTGTSAIKSKSALTQSGMAIYCTTSKPGLSYLGVVFASDFDYVSGADNVGHKGLVTGLFQLEPSFTGSERVQHVLVTGMHPSPYVQVTVEKDGYVPQLAMPNAENNEQIYTVHLSQLMQAGEYLDILLNLNDMKYLKECKTSKQQVVFRPFRELLSSETLNIVGSFIVGDMNINRYAVEPGGKGEVGTMTAAACCGNEYWEMLRSLNAEQPQIVPDTDRKRWKAQKLTVQRKHESRRGRHETKGWNEMMVEQFPEVPPGFFGQYTWDAQLNTLALDPLWGAQYQWIDYVLYQTKYENMKPLYMDNRAIRMADDTRPFPEIAAYFQKDCVKLRKDIGDKNHINEKVLENLAKNPVMKDYWDYGYKSDDENITDEHFDPKGRAERDQKNPYRMLTDYSDHYGVLSFVMLNTPKSMKALLVAGKRPACGTIMKSSRKLNTVRDIFPHDLTAEERKLRRYPADRYVKKLGDDTTPDEYNNPHETQEYEGFLNELY